MSIQGQMSNLLARWDELRGLGQDVSPDELCREFPDLLPEVRRHIDAIKAVEQRFTGARATITTGEWATPLTATSGGTAPHIAGYEILGELGRGGMGVVYKARDLHLKRLVALKVIRFRGTVEEEELKRFRMEAEAVARLQHPNIVHIHAIGEATDGPYISLEYCAGGSLADRLDGTPLPPHEATLLVETLAGAIQKAHDAHIVHRDLKPGNVLLSRDGTPKVTDFGLAKKLDDDSTQTQTGAVMGTPSYMAPEQAAGKTREIGPAADVYALGAVLYELLTGRPPFKASSAIETINQVLSDEPVAPRQLQPSMPHDVETIVLKCLQKDPSKRYKSADALMVDLRHFQAGEPILARPVTSLERTLKWARRNPILSVLYITAAVLLIAIAVVSSVLRSWAFSEMTRADKQKTLADQKAKSYLQEKTRAEHSLYISYMHMAQQALKESRTRRAEELLDGVGFWHPRTGRAEWNKLRDWEWYYLRHVLKQPGKAVGDGLALIGHTQPVTSLSWHPDNCRLATASRDGSIKIWNAITGKELRSISPNLGSLNSVCWHPDGQLLACAANNTAQVLNGISGEGFGNLQGQTEVSWSPDGQSLACVGDVFVLHEVLRSRLGDLEFRAYLKRTPKEVLSKTLFRAHSQINIWNVKNWTKSDEIWLVGNARNGARMAWKPGGRAMAFTTTKGIASIASLDGSQPVHAGLPDFDARLFVDWQFGEILPRERKQAKSVTHELKRSCSSVASSPHGEQLAIGCDDGDIFIGGWATMYPDSAYPTAESRKYEVRFQLRGHSAAVQDLAWNPQSQRLASVDADGVLKIWDTELGLEILTLEGHTRASWSPDGINLAAPGKENAVTIWTAQDSAN